MRHRREHGRGAEHQALGTDLPNIYLFASETLTEKEVMGFLATGRTIEVRAV
jgi:hypothetical protein